MSDQYQLLADFHSKQVGCVLLQVMARCDSSLLYRFGFDTKSWAVAPTKGMQRIVGTESEWRRFAEACNEAHAKK